MLFINAQKSSTQAMLDIFNVYLGAYISPGGFGENLRIASTRVLLQFHHWKAAKLRVLRRRCDLSSGKTWHTNGLVYYITIPEG